MGRAIRHPRSYTRRSISVSKHGDRRSPHKSLEHRTIATFLHVESLSTSSKLPSRHSITIAIMALRNKNIANSHTVTRTYYLRPTGQSKVYSLQLLMHSKHTWGLPSTRHRIYIWTYLGAAPPHEVSAYKFGLFNDPRKHAVFRLYQCLYQLLQVQEHTTFLGYLDTELVESFGFRHGLAWLSFELAQRQRHRKDSYPILLDRFREDHQQSNPGWFVDDEPWLMTTLTKPHWSFRGG